MSEQMTLGYWNLRGLAHSIRLLLKVSNANYKEIFYDEKAGEKTWFEVKPTLPLDFPNLPYLYDGEIKATQSLAILRYLGRKFNLAPETEVEKVRSEVLEMQIIDWRTEGFVLWYSPKEKFEKDRQAYEESTKTRMVQLSKAFGPGPYVLGDKLTYVDFLLYEYLDNQRRFIKGLLNPHDNLLAFVKAIEAIPQVKEYLESDEYKQIFFITAAFSNWGNRTIPNHLEVE